MQGDTFYDKLVSFLASVSNDTESRKIWDVGSPSTVLCAFVYGRVFTHGYDYEEKLEPQPQLLVELGLMKLKPWRMRVSSKSRTMPVR